MAVIPDSIGSHPVLACAERIGDDLAGIAEVPVDLMSAADKAAALMAVSAAVDRLEGLRLRLRRRRGRGRCPRRRGLAGAPHAP